MKILGFYGLSDVGKTSLVEALTQVKTKKFKLEQTRGITLKVSYASFFGKNQEEFYILDNPGHYSYAIETLRNIDLIDLGVYVFNCEVLRDQVKKKLALDHYKVFKKIFETVGVPYLTLLNKAETCKTQVLDEFYTSHLKNWCLPSCARLKESLIVVKEAIESHPLKEKDQRTDLVFRTVKSFDVNPGGVQLKEVKGGILGGYFYHDISSNQSYILNKKNKAEFDKVDFKKIVPGRIGTVETYYDPVLFKNDLKKGTFIIKEKDRDMFSFIESKFKLKLEHVWRRPLKTDNIILVLSGQVFKCTLKKWDKSEVVLIKKDPEMVPLYIPSSLGLILIQKKQVEHIFQIIAITRTLPLEKTFSD